MLGAEGTTAENGLSTAFGMLHPLLVHFPVALLITAIPAEFLRLRKGSEAASPTARFLVILGAVTALASATTGWMKASVDGGGYLESDLTWHRITGIVVALTSLVLVALAPRDTAPPGRLRLFRILLVVEGLILTACGHFGAVLAGHAFEPSAFWKALTG